MANGSNTVYPFPSPSASLPVGSTTSIPAAAMRPAGRLAVHDPLEGHRDVAEATVPLARGVLLEGQWRHQFNLVPSPDAPLVDQLVAHGPVIARGHRRRPHHFVLGERLFGEKRPRQIQVASWPARVTAERSHVADRQRDLVRRERIAERRHVAVEAAHRSTFMDDG